MNDNDTPAPERGWACVVCGGTEKDSSSRYLSVCSKQCYDKDYYQRNKERKDAQNKEWCLANPDEVSGIKKRSKKKRHSEVRSEAAQGQPRSLMTYKRRMLSSAKKRAKDKGLPFNITTDDFDIPATCPVLGIELTLGGAYGDRDSSPSLDRVVPLLGYVSGNVLVVSFRANRIKSDGTCQELQQVADFYRKHMTNDWMKT